MKIRALPIAFTVMLAACGEVPTSAAVAGPRYDGGAYVIGSGNRSDSTTNTAANSQGESAAGGAYVIGSGN
jgi:hypothetical protein